MPSLLGKHTKMGRTFPPKGEQYAQSFWWHCVFGVILVYIQTKMWHTTRICICICICSGWDCRREANTSVRSRRGKVCKRIHTTLQIPRGRMCSEKPNGKWCDKVKTYVWKWYAPLHNVWRLSRFDKEVDHPDMISFAITTQGWNKS